MGKINNPLSVALVTIVSFSAYFFLDELYFANLRNWFYGIIGQLGVSHLLAYGVVGIPIVVGTLLIHRFKEFAYSLGLDRSMGKGAVVSLIFTLPMFIGYAIVFNFSTEVTLDKVLTGVIAAAFFEELYFRGFFFGQLYRFANIGFIPSILIGSLLFASVHLYQSQELPTLIGIFMTTFLGAILFAWVYIEWNSNLWVAIFLHLFMNLSWMLFSVSENALGDNYANVFRVLTIALTIIGTIAYKRRQGVELAINRNTLWRKQHLKAS